MTDRQLECIVAIAKHRSIIGAAKDLFVSPSSLSQLLTKAEKELGVQLFQRTTTAMVPTYAGDQYLKAAAEIFQIKQNLIYHLTDLDGSERGRITIGIAPKRSWLFMPVVLSAYMKRFPDVEIVFIEEDQQLLEDMLLQGKIDVAFITAPLIKPGLEYRFLYREYILLALPFDHPANHTVVKDGNVDLKSVAHIPFVLVRQGHQIRQLCDQAFSDFCVVPNICLESQSLDVCFQMSAYGIGATMIPDTLAKGHMYRERVSCYRLGERYSRLVAISYRKNMYLSHILSNFISIAEEQIIMKYANDSPLDQQFLKHSSEDNP